MGVVTNYIVGAYLEIDADYIVREIERMRWG